MSSKRKTTATKEEARPALVPKLRFPEFRGSTLRSVQLGEVTEEGRRRNGKKHSVASVMGVSKADGIVPMEARVIAADIERYKLVEHDWFAYNPMRLNIGSIARWNGDSEILVSPDYVVFKCITDDQSGLAPGYLDHFRQTKAWGDFVNEGGDGGVRVRIYYKDIARLQLALPSLPEQQKIAECLCSVDELMAAQARKVDALKTHKEGLMQQLFPREGETQPDLRFSNEGDWTVVGLPDVAFFQEGPGIMAVDFRSEGVPLVRLAGVNGSVVTLTGCNYLDPARVKLKWSHFRLELNDLLISTSATFGLSSIVTEVAAGAVFYTGLIRFKPSSDRLDRGYLKFYLSSPHFERQAESAAVGGGIKHFGPTHLKQMKIPIPPLAEQQGIASCLSSLGDFITAETQKLEALKIHKKGLMQQLFPSPGAFEA